VTKNRQTKNQYASPPRDNAVGNLPYSHKFSIGPSGESDPIGCRFNLELRESATERDKLSHLF